MPGSVVLIVVDNPAHRALFNRHFAQTPHHLIYAHDGEDGFDRFAEVKPDLVVAHIHAARLDGTILCQLIRQQPRGETVPVVLCGEDLASDPEAHRERVRVVGADDVLPLPFDRTTLLGCLTPLLSFGRPEGQPLPERDESSITPSNVPIISAVDDDEAASEAELEALPRSSSWPSSGEELLAEPEVPAGVSPRRDNDAQDTVISAMVPPPELERPVRTLPLLERPAHLIEPTDAPFVHEAETHIEQVEKAYEPPAKREERRGRPLHESTVPLPRKEELHPPTRPTTFEIPSARTLPDGAPARAGVELHPPHAAPAIEEPSRSGLLEEPSIAAQESSSKVRMIQEPARDLTPSASERGAPRDGGRRGLDESQLGKRLAKRVRAMYRVLDEVDYYQLLGVDLDAGAEQLRRAYFELSLEFHPDRFFLLRSGDLKEKIYAIYRRVTEAYTVLSDERRRSAYEEGRRLRREKRAVPEHRSEGPVRATPAPSLREAAPPASDGFAKSGTDAMRAGLEVPIKDQRARRWIDLAKASYAQGHLQDARLHLHLALAYEADNPILRAAIDKVALMSRPRP